MVGINLQEGELLPMDRRVISPERCEDLAADDNEALRLDINRASFIVKKRNLAVAKSYKLGSLWLMLDPLLHSLVYLFVFTVIRYRTNPGSVMIGLALIRGLQQCLVYGATSNMDFTAGIKIERIRSRAIIFSEILHIGNISFHLSIGTVLVVLFLDASYWIIPLFPIICVMNGLVWYSLGRVMSPLVKGIPDFKNVVSYIAMLMFFVSPALYPLDQTEGFHRTFCLYNPFTFFSEPARAIAFGEEGFGLLDMQITAMVSLLLIVSFFYGLALIDKQRWRYSTWE